MNISYYVKAKIKVNLFFKVPFFPPLDNHANLCYPLANLARVQGDVDLCQLVPLQRTKQEDSYALYSRGRFFRPPR